MRVESPFLEMGENPFGIVLVVGRADMPTALTSAGTKNIIPTFMFQKKTDSWLDCSAAKRWRKEGSRSVSNCRRSVTK